MYQDNRKKQQLDELELRRAQARELGGWENVVKQKKKGKLTARERIALLLDPGSFCETGMFARNRCRDYKAVPADAVITGYGKIDGRKVYVFSQDFTAMGGTLSEVHGKKMALVIENAMKSRCPVIGINDSGGARIQDGVEGLVGYGKIAQDQHVPAIHANPEIAFQEKQAAALLAGELEKNGFTVERGVAGLETAFVATHGQGKPAVGFLAEYDALRGLGHACGHNLIATWALGAGIALKRALDDLQGTVKVIGTPGEEGAGGKVIMAEAGVFAGLDAAIMMMDGDGFHALVLSRADDLAARGCGSGESA